MPHPLHLVACVAGKLPHQAPAAELYISDWFRKARAYVEQLGAPWRILSAEHGLLDPRQVVAPYDTTLARMSAAQRRAWAARVRAQLDTELGGPRPVVFLAGRLYRDELLTWPSSAAVPMAGLGIGSQKAWLAARAG